jgi:hypothetical protein
VTERAEHWVQVASDKLGGLSAPEAELARAAAVRILGGWDGPEWDTIREQNEVDAMGAVVAMVELARAIARGQAWRRGPVARA